MSVAVTPERVVRTPRRRLADRRSDDRGVTVVLLGLVLAVLMIFAAFSVDIGTAYAQRRQDQGAVDTAALAGGVRFLTTGDYVQAIRDVKARVADDMGVKVTDADWAACNDPDALATLSTVYSATEGTPCISFGTNPDTKALQLRVRLPDVANATGFARVIGIDELKTHAVAQVDIGSPLGGAFPAFVMSGVAAGSIVCVFSGPPGHPTPCNGQTSGQFGTFDPVYYAPGCLNANSGQGQYWTAAPAIAQGIDHMLSVFNPSFPVERRNGDQNCTVLAPNMVDNIQGVSGNIITQGMLIGNDSGGPAYDGRLDGGPYSDGSGGLNAAPMAGLPIDNAPLWTFLVNPVPSSAPLQCRVAQQMSPKRDVAVANLASLEVTNGLTDADGHPLYATPEDLMAACLGNWTSAVGPIFSDDLAKSRRAVAVPRYIESVSNSDGWNHIRDFVPLFLSGEFKDTPNGNPVTIAADPTLTHWAGAPIPANGQLHNAWNPNGQGQTKDLLGGVAGMYVPCGSLPENLCRPSGDPGDNGFGGEVHSVLLSK